MRPSSRWLSSSLHLLSLGVLFLIIPLAGRWWLGWSDGFGYLSDLAIGSLLIALLYRRPLWLALPVMVASSLITLGAAELVGAVGRMPEPSDLKYLMDPQFVGHSTQGGGLTYPWLAIALAIALLACALLWRRPTQRPARAWLALPVALLAAHAGIQYLHPSEAERGSSSTCRTSCWPAPSTAASWRWRTGSTAISRKPRRTSPASPASTSPAPRCWPSPAARACW